MKIHWLYLALLVLSLAACNSDNAATSDTADTTSNGVKTIEVFKQFYELGQETPFLDEYGKVNRYISQDSTFLEYCKDSTIAISKETGLPIKSIKEFCYPHRDLFVSGEMQYNKEVHPSGQAYRRVVLKSITDYNIDGIPYKVYRMFSVISQDHEGQKVLVSTNEYWNEDLGMLVKVDENFPRKKRRVIQLEKANHTDGTPILVKELINRIHNDSTEWVTLDDEGQPWF